MPLQRYRTCAGAAWIVKRSRIRESTGQVSRHMIAIHHSQGDPPPSRNTSPFACRLRYARPGVLPGSLRRSD